MNGPRRLAQAAHEIFSMPAHTLTKQERAERLLWAATFNVVLLDEVRLAREQASRK